MRISNILKFLFPEYQIIQTISKHGFIASSAAPIPKPQPGDTRQVSSEDYSIRMQDSTAVLVNTKPHANDRQPIEIPAYSPAQAQSATPLNPADVYSKIQTQLLKQFVGQKTAIEDLIVAFKRPHIVGIQHDQPRNTIFIVGAQNSGKQTLLSLTVEAFAQENLLSRTSSAKVNLALYPTPSEQQLFLSDLYKALYGKNDIVLFENFESCHPNIIAIISKLVATGKYQLDVRYSLQNNNLVESSGILLQSSISELSANNKYFVFTTNENESKIVDIFGSKFIEQITDIVVFADYNEQDIKAIVHKLCAKLASKCAGNLSLRLVPNNAFLDFLSSKYKKSIGFGAIEAFLNTDIYKALSEYKLRRSPAKDALLSIGLENGELCAETMGATGNVKFALTPYMPKRNTSNLEEVKRELASIIGLSKVKDYVLDLENNLKVRQIRDNAGFKNTSLAMHMIFTGNPGTGKTTVARIIAKYLKAIGVVSVGQLREVSRADLVGQYVGHTAKQTNEVIDSAIGGVLFIDEAYSLCRDKNDTFGLEAIDALVKAMEDHRDDLVVIMAGYEKEMADFLKSNSGLKSRFPNIICFEDYSPAEMLDIAKITAISKGYRIDETCFEELIRLFDKSQIKGKNDSGNGRLVRNIIESAILAQSKRITTSADTQELELLNKLDFNFANFEAFDLDKSLAKIIGLDSVKELLKGQHQLLIADEKRRKAGINADTTQTLNIVFTGNPGTGKTTIARVLASMFKDMGLLKQGHLVETDRMGLVAEYAGQTAKKTEEIFRSALGGVLFIDEAYALNRDGDAFGKESIDTLVKLIEDYRGEVAVVLAGYKKEMADFIKSNSGLQSRFPLVLDFPDYTVDELYKIALMTIANKGFKLDKNAESALWDKLSFAHKTSNEHSGNGRMVRNIVEQILRNQSARIAFDDHIVSDKLTEIITTDIALATKKPVYDLEQALAGVIGLDEVKNYIRSLNARLRMQNERKKLGLPTDDTQSLHMIFKGNPGTGKTMIARTVADVLHNIGVIRSNKLVETDRSGLVAGYVGQTALKTTEKVMQALDGVLFIDEAYSLAQGGASDFGKEAIDTLVKLMDDNRDRLVVILAGYSEDMNVFLKSNPGLKSRFPNIIEFADYATAELMQIAEQLYTAKGYVLENSAQEKLSLIFQNALQHEAFGNGRYVRNIFERSINNQSMRLITDTDLCKEELITIEATDIEEV